MRWRSLAVVVLLSGCQRDPAPPAAPSPEGPPPQVAKAPSTNPAPPAEATDESANEVEAEAEVGEPPAAVAGDPQLAPLQWSVRSADGRAEVRQEARHENKTVRCESVARVTPPGSETPDVVWRWGTCLATREQFTFVSPDSAHVLVIDPSPALQQGSWKESEVATLYEHGVRMKGMRAGAAVRIPQVRLEPTYRVTWMKSPPHYAADGGAVELETTDGRTLRLGFSGEGFPASAEEDHVFTTSVGMYRYEDAHKTTHFVNSFSDVPPRYRAKAVPVTSQVAVISGKGSLARDEPEPKPAEPKPAASTATADKGKAGDPGAPAAPGALKEARVASPAELLQRARDTVKTVNASEQKKVEALEAIH